MSTFGFFDSLKQAALQKTKELHASASDYLQQAEAERDAIHQAEEAAKIDRRTSVTSNINSASSLSLPAISPGDNLASLAFASSPVLKIESYAPESWVNVATPPLATSTTNVPDSQTPPSDYADFENNLKHAPNNSGLVEPMTPPSQSLFAGIVTSFSSLKTSIADRIDAKYDTLRDFYMGRMRVAERKIKRRLWIRAENQLDTLLENKIRPWFFSKLLNDFMPEPILRSGESMVNALWLDVREEFWHSYYESKHEDEMEEQARIASTTGDIVAVSSVNVDVLTAKVRALSILSTTTAINPVRFSDHCLVSDLSTVDCTAATTGHDFELPPCLTLVTDMTSFERFQIFYLYHSYPFDKSFWECTNDGWWCLFRLLDVLPLFCLPFWSSLVFFLCMDRTDEFQLVFFLLNLKKAQFISIGLLQGLIGWFTYYRCVAWSSVVTDNSPTQWMHSCPLDGPGSQANFTFEIVGFFLQLLMAWLAFSLLPRSQKKGAVVITDQRICEHGRLYRQAVGDKLSLHHLMGDVMNDTDPSADITTEKSSLNTEAVDVGYDSTDDGEPCDPDIAILVAASEAASKAIDFNCILEDDLAYDDSAAAATIRSRRSIGWWRYIVEAVVNLFLRQITRWRLVERLERYLPDVAVNPELRRGGYLPMLLKYDMGLFCMLVLFATLFFWVRPYSPLFFNMSENAWLLRADLMMLKTIYGVLSFPFAVFATPLAPFLLHLRETGYNEQGQCVPMHLPPSFTDRHRARGLRSRKLQMDRRASKLVGLPSHI